MAKKSTKIAITYVVTIVVTVLIIFIVGFVMMKSMNRSSEELENVEVTSSTSPEEYVPSVLDNQTTLFILDAEDRIDGTVFILTRLLPSERRFVVVPLQSDMYVNTSGTESTLYEYYKNNDVAGAKQAIQNIFGITIDKYIKFDKTTFEKAAARFENVNHVFSYSLIGENELTGETTVIRSGNQTLSPSDLTKAFTYWDYKDGETERMAEVGAIFTDFINNSHTRYQTGLDQIVSGILGLNPDTDITEYDYEFKKDAIHYMVDDTVSGCAELVLPSGTYDSASRYVIDSDFVSALKKWFSLDMEDLEADIAQTEISSEDETVS